MITFSFLVLNVGLQVQISAEEMQRKPSENQQDAAVRFCVYVCENQAHTHFSLDVHRDAQKQRHIKAHFQDVIPLMGLSHRLQNENRRDTINQLLHSVVCGCIRNISIILLICVPSNKHPAHVW